MPASAYIELHANSAFSFLRGASMPDALAAEAARLELPAVALCDRDGVYGTPRFHSATRAQGVRPLIGCELTLHDGAVLPLLVENRTGYENLCQLISLTKQTPRDLSAKAAAKAERKRPCFATWDELSTHSEGLIALTGDAEGPLLTAWQRGGTSAAATALDQLQRVFGPDRLYVEVQRHRVRGEERAVSFLGDLAAARHLPLLATGGATQATRDARSVADVFTCLRHHTTLDEVGRLLAPNAERHLHSARVMQQRFADLPTALTNTQRLADRLTFSLENLGYQFPDFPVPAGHDMTSWLREQTYAGIRELVPAVTAAYRRQIDTELALIAKLGFDGYFLIVADICRWARDHHILVQGRGSAANSVVCFALRITAVDPVKHRLLFSRFLSEGRVGHDGRPSWPDIDLDFPSGDLRESVIQEVYARYAPHGAAMTANVITYRGRGTTRELGKVLGLPDDVMDRFSSLYHGGDFPHTIDLEAQLAQSGLASDHPRAATMVRVYQQMHGLPRHLGQHSGGMVICGGRLNRVVPLEPASMPHRVVVQWDKDDCEDLGIVKVDLLGLGMMATLQDTFELCTARGDPLSLATIPADDPETFRLMQEADTIGVFQIESRAQMSTLRRFKPACFYDVAMQVAIVRPGPIVGKLVHPIIRRREGAEPIVCLDPEVHERLKPILERSYGVVLFQEQMLACAMELAAYDGAQAEELRRSMGFSRGTERLERALNNLRTAMRAHGWSDRITEMLIESASNFALYGFPESHSMSFALLAYASTWLKAHRPAEFVCGLLNNQPMGFYGPATLVQDSRRHGVTFLPVCVQQSAWRCTVEDRSGHAIPGVRLGLCYVKGLSAARTAAMLDARAILPFTSIEDWLARTSFAPAERRALAALGALNALATHRRAALWQVEAAWSSDEPLFQRTYQQSEFGELTATEPPPDVGPKARPTTRTASPRGSGFTPDTSPLSVSESSPPSPFLKPMTRAERVTADFTGMGLTAGIHPMAHVRAALPNVWRAGDLPLGRDGQEVTVAGSVICRQRPGTAKGFVFISLEDETGVANCVVTPDNFERHRLVINLEPALRISGHLQIQYGIIHIKAAKITALRLESVPAQASHDFH
ncbi:DNA polymerase III subunit alpha [Synoicihabitans lomoniglobus]|uniref:Error-prone DNA polymerase n=1 Tax=Synoicihabitans lomoniglobus TaxID=2909285 RepID=A0AAF0CM36_9BACT|nr:error-prone DNA polymerase [Opitutaceae bacterium LMO-M01]WED63573.1 error-prone DNA polymerase [Opitutaceae bacterium LMO-M01]